MKREILCEGCAKSPSVQHKQVQYPEGTEFVSNVPGVLVLSCLCDSCGKALERGQRAHAVSFGRGSMPAFITWEREYIAPDDRHEHHDDRAP